ncbi:hypothetical protein AB6A40_004357 [Gnathostoma spinigerum]|uniref:Transcription factor CBF/NF-Y/archaeal histone domain-containing protein n=1 Tax=Gnathostoma spinigerum TaxID=75299 RepID=A0ABD6EC89_9BILA
MATEMEIDKEHDNILEEIEEDQQNFNTRLPLSKVKRICKLDPDLHLISSEAVHVLTIATEAFIGLLAKAAYQQTTFEKKKTIQLKDVEVCISSHTTFEFLEGALDGWPDFSSKRKSAIILRGESGNRPVMNSNIDDAENDIRQEMDSITNIVVKDLEDIVPSSTSVK